MCNVYPKDVDENCNKEKLNKKKQQFINRPNFCGFTALHLASQNGHNQSTRELLYAGCSTTIQNDYGDSPLHTAVRYGHAGVLRILISAKCDIDANLKKGSATIRYNNIELIEPEDPEKFDFKTFNKSVIKAILEKID